MERRVFLVDKNLYSGETDETYSRVSFYKRALQFLTTFRIPRLFRSSARLLLLSGYRYICISIPMSSVCRGVVGARSYVVVWWSDLVVVWGVWLIRISACTRLLSIAVCLCAYILDGCVAPVAYPCGGVYRYFGVWVYICILLLPVSVVVWWL